VLASAIGLTAGSTSVGRWLEHRTLDARFDLRGPDPRRSSPVIIVGVDEESLGHLGAWPFPRLYHARIIQRLHAAGARLIAYDIAFDRPKAGDRRLLDAARRAAPVVFGTALVDRGGYTPVLGGRARLAAIGARAGAVYFHADSDGVVRRTVARFNGLPSFATAVGTELLGGRLDQARLARGLIDYAGPPGTVAQLGFSSVLEGRFDPRAVRGKVVVVGETASVLHDLLPTSEGPFMPGPEAQANAISTVLRDYPLRNEGPLLAAILTVGLAFLVPALGLRFGGLTCAVTAALVLILLLVAAQVAFGGGTVIELAGPAAALAASTGGTLAVSAVASGRERRRLRAMFAAYSPELVERVLSGDRAPIAPSAIVGGYRLEEVVGRGGMGVVYRATQLALERHVALKLIAPDRAADPEFRARFRQESRIAATIEHSNVIPVYEAGEDDGLLYIVMRLVDGADLGRVIDRLGPMSPDRAVDILEQVAGALDAAHGRGLIHRDVKPANVLLTIDEPLHAYLTDFGLARQVTGGTDMTSPGAWVGTLDYIAPEQLIGGPVDRRADIYSLAAVLFHCLVGTPPYRADNAAATMFAHVSAEPPLASSLRTDLPVALDEVIASGLAKDPDERPQTAGDLARAAAAAVGRRRESSPSASDAGRPDDASEDAPTAAS
jgi:CHASE2 domain-containing sensor protein